MGFKIAYILQAVRGVAFSDALKRIRHRNALKINFRRFCRETEGRRSVTREHSNFFITPISYKHEKNISLQVTQSNVTCNVDVTPCNAVEGDIDKDIEEDIKEIDKESFGQPTVNRRFTTG